MRTYKKKPLEYTQQLETPSNHFKQKLVAIIDKYPNTPIQFMGIPSKPYGQLMNWQNEPLWRL
ncbi:MAG: hypothetical protein ORN85_03025 [Sediminibacterium sp.]|nr:hypothetical protein [Sediminibacterium sp.]